MTPLSREMKSLEPIWRIGNAGNASDYTTIDLDESLCPVLGWLYKYMTGQLSPMVEGNLGEEG